MNVGSREKISFSVISCQGDSLSDEGSFYARNIGKATQKAGIIHLGANFRFTDEFTWHDYAIENLIAVNSLVLDKEQVSKNYAQGGATAGSTAKLNCKFHNGVILDRIDCQRRTLLKNFKDNGTDLKNVLFIEWSGANDLATINDPNFLSVKDAVNSRIINLTELLSKGADKFILFNLPDLSQTPRYKRLQKSNWSVYEGARCTTDSFNSRLRKEVKKVKKDHPNALIEIFDVYTRYNAYLKDKKSHQCRTDYEIKVEAPRLPLQSNVVYIVPNHANSQLEYTVEDPCGQISTKIISFEELNIPKNLWRIEESDDLKNYLCDVNFKGIMLEKTTENGDTISDIFSPVVEMKAYKDYLRKKKENDDSVSVLSCPNSLFWDDVHPTSKVHKFLAKDFTDYVGSIAKFEPSDEQIEKGQKMAETSMNKFLWSTFQDEKGMKYLVPKLLLSVELPCSFFMNLAANLSMGRKELKKKLAKNDAIFWSSAIGEQAIKVIALLKNRKHLNCLKDNKIEVNVVLNGIPLIHEAIVKRLTPNFITLLSEDGWDQRDAENNTLIHCLLKNEWWEGYKIFMEAKKNIGLDALINQKNAKGETAISIAAQKKRVELVAEWIARPTIDLTVVSSEFCKKILYLLAKGGKASLLENLLLLDGCQPKVRELLIKQIDNPINTTYHNRPRKKTALMIAAQYGHGDAVKVLLEAGANVFKRADGWTAFDYTWALLSEKSAYQVIKKARFGDLQREFTSEELKNTLAFCCKKGEYQKASTLINNKLTSLISARDTKLPRPAGIYYEELKSIIFESRGLSLQLKNRLYKVLLAKLVADGDIGMLYWLIKLAY